ncbi:hypothetical protein P9112_000823 [Eukaryota sp. TZLM1-RC]
MSISSSTKLPWIEKYRPKTLDDVIAHTDILSTLKHLLSQNRLPHLLFYGPPGTGKTSTILAIAKDMYKENFSRMTLELNASDERGIDVVRERIKDFAATGVLFSKGYKLIILDEADQMTNAAQSALRRIIEKYTNNARFCLICNNVNKIIPAIQSRCTRFRFGPLPIDSVRNCLDSIIEKENIKADVAGKDALLTLSNGDMRRVLNILHSTYLTFKEVTSANVYATTGQPSPYLVKRIVSVLLEKDLSEIVNEINNCRLEKGISLLDLVYSIHDSVVDQDWPVKVKSMLLLELGKLEERLNHGAGEGVQTAALAGVFIIARELVSSEMDKMES